MSRKQIQLTDKQVNEIEKRQKLALMYKAKERIEDYQDQVFSIIDNKGLKNDDKALETALKVLPYIIPTKKAIETTVIHRKLEDIITESIQEAEVIEIKDDQNTGKID